MNHSIMTVDDTSVNWQDRNSRDYALGGRLYDLGRPLASCGNRWQRTGWCDARTGDEASRLVSRMVAQGMSRSAAVETVVG